MVHVGKEASSVKKFCQVESLSSLGTAGELMPTNKYSDFLQAISRKLSGESSTPGLKSFVKSYRYPGMDSCATDGLCAAKCPSGIDTGKMVKALRSEAHGQLADKIAVHPTCSTRKMGLETNLLELARACATEVIWPEDIHCCGFAGDKGFNFPELNEAALKGLDEHTCSCEAGYSTSITCEIGLSLHAGIPYRSILYLVDEVTQPNTITT